MWRKCVRDLPELLVEKRPHLMERPEVPDEVREHPDEVEREDKEEEHQKRSRTSQSLRVHERHGSASLVRIAFVEKPVPIDEFADEDGEGEGECSVSAMVKTYDE